MARRKKYPKLPNGYGSIKYLGKNRRNCYAVHPPTKEFNEDGIPLTPKALCYVDDWMKGFAVLTAYKAGTYVPGMEKNLTNIKSTECSDVIRSILADYSVIRGSEQIEEKTFSEVYEEFFEYKFNRDKSRSYSKASRTSCRAAFKNCSSLHFMPFRSIRHDDLQRVIDECPLKHSSKELILSLFHQIYAYGEIYELCDKDYSAHVKLNCEDDDEHGVPFSEEDLAKLWKDKENPIAEMLLIMCYSGFRIQEYKVIEVNTKDYFFKGGLKTRSSKERIVPIHSGIIPMVENRMHSYGSILPMSPVVFRKKMYDYLEEQEIKRHTPHDCRHTFSSLCEKYQINENDRKRMLGHSFGADITNSVYGHRSLEDLRTEIEKIKICY